MSRNQQPQQQGQRIQVPDELREVLLEFTISYLLEQPGGEVVDYAADYFTRLKDSRTTALIYQQGSATGGLDAASPDDESTLSGEDGKILRFSSKTTNFHHLLHLRFICQSSLVLLFFRIHSTIAGCRS